MRYSSTKLLAMIIAVAEIVSVGLAATSASAQSHASQQRKIEQQQRTIAQQQQQILKYRRMLHSQQQLAGQQTQATEPSTGLGDLFGRICPPHYYLSQTKGWPCLPDLDYLRR